MGRYQVVGECAHVVVKDVSGVSAMNLLYKGAFLPDGVDESRLKHLIDTGLVAEVGEVPLGPNAAVAQDGRVGIPPLKTTVPKDADTTADRSMSDADREAEAKRAAAREKLAEIGGTPDGRSSEAVWVEYAVAQGTDRTEATKAGKAELQKLYAKS